MRRAMTFKMHPEYHEKLKWLALAEKKPMGEVMEEMIDARYANITVILPPGIKEQVEAQVVQEKKEAPPAVDRAKKNKKKRR